MIKLFKPFIPPGLDDKLLATLHSGYVTQGEKVEDFEDALAIELQNKQVLSVNSGTSAIHLAIRLANIGPGDEVITTPMTCIATNVPIAWERARIVWADVDPFTGLIDPEDVKRKITDKTKAIVSVDWGGLPVNYDALGAIAREHDIVHISDAAHSLGAVYKDMHVGHPALADFTAFSFQAIKTITTVDGGALTVRDPDQYERGKRLRWFGVDRENKVQFRGEIDVPEVGLKMHMNDVNATIGLQSLKFLQANVRIQRVNASLYQQHLHPYYYVHPFLLDNNYTKSACWLATVLLPDENERSVFQEYMRRQDIETSQVHWRNDKHSAFAEFLPETPLEGLDIYSRRMICIPVHNQLTKKEVNKVIDAMNAFASS